MDRKSNLFPHPQTIRAQARVVALKYDHRRDKTRQSAMRLTLLWLLLCCAFVVSLSTAFSLSF